MRQIPYIAFFPIIIITIIAYKVMDNLDSVNSAIKMMTSIMVPFIWAFVIAYLVNPILMWMQKKTNMSRMLVLVLVYFVIISVVVLFFVLAIPSLVANLVEIINQIPTYMTNIDTFITKQESIWQKFGVIDALESIEASVKKDFTTSNMTKLNSLVSGTLNGVWGFTSGFLKFFIGLIISIYMLHDKEKFEIGIKRFNYAIFDKNTADRFLKVVHDCDKVFSKYIVGKVIDSLIIGMICFVGLLFLKAPYAMLLAIIVGVTNLIPYFGPFIGAIPAVIITLFYSPITALWVALFILALQQLDGYVIGPKILGDSVGMSPFWIILAIIIGGGLFGVLGMLVGVPVMAVIRNMLEEYIDYRLQQKKVDDMI